MSDLIEQLRNKRAAAVSEARAIAEPASNANRKLTEDEQRRFEWLMADVDMYDGRIKQLVGREQRDAETGRTFDELAGRPVSGPRTLSAADQDIARAFRSAIFARTRRRSSSAPRWSTSGRPTCPRSSRAAPAGSRSTPETR